MSCFNGPGIATSGLILHLDAANRKSFGGVGADRVGGILPTWSTWSDLVGSAVAYSSQGSSGVYLNVINVTTGGGVNWWYSANGGQACTSSTQYTITAKVRYSGNTPSANLFYVRQYNSVGAQTSEGGKFTTSQMIPIGNDMYLAWATFTTDTTAVSFYVHGYEYVPIQIWLEDVQCKLGGLGDISGCANHGTLTGAVTLSSSYGGVVQFSGNNYITTGLNLSSGTYTVMAAARYTTIGGRIITAATNNWLMGHWSSYTESHYAEGWVSSAPAGASDTNWRILAASGDSSADSWQMYVNGNRTYSNNGGSQGPNNLGINVYPERSTGEVGFLMAYNRVLSAAEIQQNFNALRSRFGI